MHNVGLIGGVASGKSTVSQAFAALGAGIISADLIAKQLTASGEPAYNSIVKKLGSEFLAPNGELDRSLLRAKMTQDANIRAWLEDLLHPLIRQRIKLEQTKILAAYCIVEIPVFRDPKNHPDLQRILLVSASHEQQLQRLMDRDHVSINQATALIKCQIQPAVLRTLANDELVNTGNMNDLLEQVRVLHQRYLSWSTLT